MAKMRSVRLLKAGITLFFGMVLCSSCDRNLSQKRLSDIESYIDSRPDSALAAIRQIDTTALHGRAVKAKYALLHAIALDKNYIDTADTRIVQPAVDYYDRHGSPEERLKAYMYLGTEQYNAGHYNQAIVSFSQADEFAEQVDDQNLLGILYSRMADTFTMTRDHSEAAGYIEMSRKCFRQGGRKDHENYERLREAENLLQRRKIREADSCYNALLTDSTTMGIIKGKACMDYAMFLLSLPNSDEGRAMKLFSDALNYGCQFEDSSQLYAYAYLLGRNGNKEEADAIWKRTQINDTKDRYNYNFWKHYDCVRQGNHKDAYKYLWLAMTAHDTIIKNSFANSAANSHSFYLKTNKAQQEKKIQGQRIGVIIVLLLCLILVLTSAVIFQLYQNAVRKRKEETERMTIAIENIKEQLLNNKEANTKRARFSFLADVYEDAYRNNPNDEQASENLTNVLRKRIGNLKSDPEAQRNFELMIDNEMDGIMSKFKKDCPALTESEYRMASYYFAGFDNTTVMIIMGISSLENTRSRKSYFRRKLSEKFGETGEYYSTLIGR